MLQIFSMKFVPKFFFLLVLTVALGLSSCNSSDEENDVEEVNDYGEQSLTDDATIQEFLQTHTYNYEDFTNPSAGDIAIVIDTLAGSSANKTPLSEQVSFINVPLSNSEGEESTHKLYYLIARQGERIADRPSIADSVYVSYQGKLLNGSSFDQSVLPVWFDTAAVILGFRYGLQHFAPGTYDVSDNGEIDFLNFGKGLIILPSTLGYFSRVSASIPAYSPLIFDVSVFTTNTADHDADGILSINEDIDGDGNPYNDDTDADGITNMYDTDDDGDGILTVNEYDEDNDGTPDDADNDGIPSYLDADE